MADANILTRGRLDEGTLTNPSHAHHSYHDIVLPDLLSAPRNLNKGKSSVRDCEARHRFGKTIMVNILFPRHSLAVMDNNLALVARYECHPLRAKREQQVLSDNAHIWYHKKKQNRFLQPQVPTPSLHIYIHIILENTPPPLHPCEARLCSSA